MHSSEVKQPTIPSHPIFYAMLCFGHLNHDKFWYFFLTYGNKLFVYILMQLQSNFLMINKMLVWLYMECGSRGYRYTRTMGISALYIVYEQFQIDSHILGRWVYSFHWSIKVIHPSQISSMLVSLLWWLGLSWGHFHTSDKGLYHMTTWTRSNQGH